MSGFDHPTRTFGMCSILSCQVGDCQSTRCDMEQIHIQSPIGSFWAILNPILNLDGNVTHQSKRIPTGHVWIGNCLQVEHGPWPWVDPRWSKTPRPLLLLLQPLWYGETVHLSDFVRLVAAKFKIGKARETDSVTRLRCLYLMYQASVERRLCLRQGLGRSPEVQIALVCGKKFGPVVLPCGIAVGSITCQISKMPQKNGPWVIVAWTRKHVARQELETCLQYNTIHRWTGVSSTLPGHNLDGLATDRAKKAC